MNLHGRIDHVRHVNRVGCVHRMQPYLCVDDQLIHTRIPGQVGLTRRKGCDHRLSRGGVGVAVNGIISTLILWTENIAGRQHEPHGVVARCEIGEEIVAGPVRRRRIDEATRVVIQVNRHIINANFTTIFDAIPICIIPYPVTN